MSWMESDFPEPDTSICTSAAQLSYLCTFTLILEPKHGIRPTNLSIQDSDLLHWLRNTPDVHVRIE